MADSIDSASDSELVTIASQCFTTMDGNIGAYPGVTPVMLAGLEAARDSFQTDLTIHIAAQADAKAATQTKEGSRDALETILRSLRNISKSGGASEANMAALGIPTQSQAAPANATVPAASVDTSVRLRHTIKWTDAASLDNKRKPRGTMGVEIWVKLDGPPPTDEKDCTFLTLDAFTPYVVEYEGSDAGKMAHYLLRWRMRDGAVGGWGETISATITG